MNHHPAQIDTAERLLERLHYIKINPSQIAVLGDAGLLSGLQQLYPEADIQKLSFEQLGTLDQDTVDLCVSNLSLSTCDDLESIFKQLHHAVKPGGLLLFSSLGPDSLKELRASFAAVDNLQHVWDFTDMHDVGDALLKAGWLDPVMDQQELILQYKTMQKLCQDLQCYRDVRFQARPGLYAKGKWQTMSEHYKALHTGYLPVSLELVFGHAWSAAPKKTAGVNADGEVLISLDQIKR